MIRTPHRILLGLCLALTAAAPAAGRDAPPDLAVAGMIAPDVALPGQATTIRVRITSRGYAGQRATVELSVDGRALARRAVVLTDKPVFVEFVFTPAKPSHRTWLNVWAAPMPGETVRENNRAERVLTIVEPTVNVLYVEGRPRWEYRYVRSILLRDASVKAKFLPLWSTVRPAKPSGPDLAAFPKTRDELLGFDVVILGDVPPGSLTNTQLSHLSEFVVRAGGSLIVLPGSRHQFTAWTATPVERLLPVRIQPGPWQPVADTVHPVLTGAGRASGMLQLDASPKRTAALWSHIRPLGRLPAVTCHPTTTVLATLSAPAAAKKPHYPLIAQRRYGKGKVLYIGTDSLWRLRSLDDAKPHGRFWHAAVVSMALSRLLGPATSHLETDRPVYPLGQQVRIYAHLLDTNHNPVIGAARTAKIHGPGAAAAKKVIQVLLRPVARLPGLYEAHFTPTRPGTYRIATPHPTGRTEELSTTIRVSAPRP